MINVSRAGTKYVSKKISLKCSGSFELPLLRPPFTNIRTLRVKPVYRKVFMKRVM